METNILIIDDDVKLLELLKDYLQQFQFRVLTATNPRLGKALAREKGPDLIILDVMLPEQNGFDVLKDIRKESSTPVVMLTARGEVTDRIVGLELGADDYLPKPFEPRELVARIQTILRRGKESATQKLAFDNLVLDLEKREVSVQGKPVELSTAEFDVLALLASHKGRVFNRDQIIEELKGSGWAQFDRSVDVLISRIRQKIGDDSKKPRFLKTIWGTGYKFIGQRDSHE